MGTQLILRVAVVCSSCRVLEKQMVVEELAQTLVSYHFHNEPFS